ncbi:DUF6214 family protein [Streptomyces hirsutus]
MSVWPAWEVREGERVTRWLHVRLGRCHLVGCVSV